jgi:hypothetical protein
VQRIRAGDVSSVPTLALKRQVQLGLRFEPGDRPREARASSLADASSLAGFRQTPICSGRTYERA